MASTDIVLDENYEPVIQNGDFVVGDADEQNVALILLSNPGEWKNAPLVGVGLHRYLKGSEPDVKVRLERNLRIQLEDMAGYKIASLINTGDVADMLQNLKLEIK